MSIVSHLKARSQNSGEVYFAEFMPGILNEYLLPGARPLVAEFPSGHYLAQEIQGDGYSCWHHTILLKEDDTFHISVSESLISLNFCIKNSFFLFKSNQTEQSAFHEGQYNMNYLSKMDLSAGFQKGRLYCFLTIFYSREHLSKMALHYPFLSKFLKAGSDTKDSSLFSENQFSTKEITKIMSLFLNEKYKDADTNTCIRKGRVLELLAKAIEHTPDNHIVGNSIKLNKQDAERIYEARTWLDQQFNRAVTLFELSKKAGMNVHKLSIGFLQMTGTTIFHYHRKVRMAKAVHLLEETDLNLFEIGTEVGYIDAKTFSKEFKKYKGITPSEYRRQLRLQ